VVLPVCFPEDKDMTENRKQRLRLDIARVMKEQEDAGDLLPVWMEAFNGMTKPEIENELLKRTRGGEYPSAYFQIVKNGLDA
jgi:hypothetical protein